MRTLHLHAPLALSLVLGISAAALADESAEAGARAAEEAKLRAEIESLRAELSETREMIDGARRELETLRGEARGDEALLERWRAEREGVRAERRLLRGEVVRVVRSRDALDRSLELERRRVEARRLLADEPLRAHADPQFVPRDFARRHGSIHPHATFVGHHLLHPRLRFGHVTHLRFTRFRHLHFPHHRFGRLPSVRKPGPDRAGDDKPDARGPRARRLNRGIVLPQRSTPRVRTPTRATPIEPRMVTPARPRGSIRSGD